MTKSEKEVIVAQLETAIDILNKICKTLKEKEK